MFHVKHLYARTKHACALTKPSAKHAVSLRSPHFFINATFLKNLPPIMINFSFASGSLWTHPGALYDRVAVQSL